MDRKELPSAVYIAEVPGGKELAPALRAMFSSWGLEPDNPFGKFAKPGGMILIKPNWVLDFEPGAPAGRALVTSPGLLRELMELSARALGGKGTVVVGDAPLQCCDFARLMAACGMKETAADLKQAHPGVEFILEDWRLTVTEGLRPGGALSYDARQKSGESAGRHELVDLGESSFLEEISDRSARFRVTQYSHELLTKNHSKGVHRYLVSKRIREADVIINAPKLKTHIKAGLTCALKNCIGINGHKEFLPHHTKGSSDEGGDNYIRASRLRRMYEDIYDYYWSNKRDMSRAKAMLLDSGLHALWMLARYFGGRDTYAGSWRGNDTLWRTILDLNRILYFPQSGKQPKVFNIADAVIAGEGEGPLTPEPKLTGLLAGSENPAYLDCALARLMGYNPVMIPTVYQAIYNRKSPFAGPPMPKMDIFWNSAPGASPRKIELSALPDLKFKKPKYWEGAESGILPE